MANINAIFDTHLFIDRIPQCNHSFVRLHRLNASSFLERLHLAYLSIDWTQYDVAVVLRPDTVLTKPPQLRRMCNVERTTYVLSGNFKRRYIFHDRDWDFGYVVCDTHLFRAVTVNNRTKTARIPALPRSFRGCWDRTCTGKWRYPYMENVIRRHNEHNVSIRNADEHNVFLALTRGKPTECHQRRLVSSRMRGANPHATS